VPRLRRKPEAKAADSPAPPADQAHRAREGRPRPDPRLGEPTTGLDEAGSQRTMALLRRLMAGRTTILITHDLRLVDGADQALVLGETMPGRWSVPGAVAAAAG
jgi:ABC-type hemin transport system ATPase subunit